MTGKFFIIDSQMLKQRKVKMANLYKSSLDTTHGSHGRTDVSNGNRRQTVTGTKHGIVVVGYPAAGKTTVSHIIAGLTDSVCIETGDIVRDGAREYFSDTIEEIGSHELGEYSTMRRKQDGGDYVATDVIEQLQSQDSFPRVSAVISGMRDKEAFETLREFFDILSIVAVTAEPETRLQRLQERGKNDESDFTRNDLEMRDQREKDWGTAYWMSAERADESVYVYTISNDTDSLLDLTSNIQSVLD